ncbi:hypothetical protein HUS23_11430 [Ectothiorhodospiraceae bacterium 2226]|nr:hypothetical protein HUS23_11430 [Ectothiorhodospiraceae bacterium 2226]
MEKKDFQPDTRYTVTMRDEAGKLRPANLYVYRLYDDFMIVRLTNNDGLLRKMKYDDIIKIVKTTQVRPEERFTIPDAVLKEAVWKDRNSMFRYSSAPQRGK